MAVQPIAIGAAVGVSAGTNTNPRPIAVAPIAVVPIAVVPAVVPIAIVAVPAMMVSTDVTRVTSANWVTYVSTTATAAISVHRPAATAPGYVAASASASATANKGYEIATIRCGGLI